MSFCVKRATHPGRLSFSLGEDKCLYYHPQKTAYEESREKRLEKLANIRQEAGSKKPKCYTRRRCRTGHPPRR